MWHDANRGNDMSGKDGIRFSQLFNDTCRAHGVAWAHKYYLKRGMRPVEFCSWLGGYVAQLG